ncbi:MAG: hypothetical protein QM714_14150 [Nocardioides sp.]|uniref:hypothetical protein n=1 Tax=Nocardioides sp. TaxID=35761 RepID=UPI0039E2A801
MTVPGPGRHNRARHRPGMHSVVLGRSGLLDELGEHRLWHSISAGVKQARLASYGATPAAENGPAEEAETLAPSRGDEDP